MIGDKLSGYLGFCAKSRNLAAGYNTCLSLINRNRVRLLIVAEDSSENTVKKMTQKCNSHDTEVRIFGKKDELSAVTGRRGNSVFAVTDRGFAKVIKEEIDRLQSEESEVF